MYEVEFDISTEVFGTLFAQARIDTTGIDLNGINGQVFNCVGAAPLKPLGFNPSYDQGARGPTPRVSGFTPERLTVTFPAYIVVAGNDSVATRHYLNENVTKFFEACVKLAARRGDLIPQALMGVTIRRLLEENEPSDENATHAHDLYSAVDTYDSVLIVYAGGDQSNYTVTFDVMKRPQNTRIDNYDGSTSA